MRKSQYLLSVLKRSRICDYIICMNVPFNRLAHFMPQVSLYALWKHQEISGYRAIYSSIGETSDKIWVNEMNTSAVLGGRPFSKYAKFSKKLTFLNPCFTHERTCAYQGVRIVSFSENFTYVLNGWSLVVHKIVTT